MQPLSALTIVALLVFFVVVPEGGVALQCYQCGQYTDGVGSITPCISYTAEKHLKDCPSSQSNYCIKYVSEGSEVRDCANECKERKKDFGTNTYCCTEEGCNPGSVASAPGLWVVAAVAAGLVLRTRL